MRKSGSSKASFSLVDSIVTTAPEFISLPVAGKVKTVPNGTAFSLIKIRFCNISIGFLQN
jgi:hypothetical protein